jgi:hypothetical protein
MGIWYVINDRGNGDKRVLEQCSSKERAERKAGKYYGLLEGWITVERDMFDEAENIPGDRPCLKCHLRKQSSRGNCDFCYERNRLRVFAGDTTWEELERQGLALPLTERGARTIQTKQTFYGECRRKRIG